MWLAKSTTDDQFQKWYGNWTRQDPAMSCIHENIYGFDGRPAYFYDYDENIDTLYRRDYDGSDLFSWSTFTGVEDVMDILVDETNDRVYFLCDSGSTLRCHVLSTQSFLFEGTLSVSSYGIKRKSDTR